MKTKKEQKNDARRRTPKVTRRDSPTASKARESRVKAVATARERLRAAIDRACIARGDAQWTNGYRAAATFRKTLTLQEEQRLYEKELSQIKECALMEERAEGLMRALVRAVKASR